MALVLKKIREAPPKPSTLAAGLPGRWDEVVLRCLACRPDDRYGGALEIVAAGAAALARAAAGYWGWRWWEARPNTSPEAIAAMRAGAWHRTEGLLRRETTTDAQARLAEALLELDRVEGAKDIVLALPRTRRVEAMKLLAQRRFGDTARAFAALPDRRVDECRIQDKTEPEWRTGPDAVASVHHVWFRQGGVAVGVGHHTEESVWLSKEIDQQLSSACHPAATT